MTLKESHRVLIQSVPTRWNSSLDMVERYLFLKPAVYAAVASLEKSKIKGVPPMPQNLQLAEDFVECMMPIKKITTLLCKEDNPTPYRNGIFHRDVKPENILIKDDLLKLADFGSCRSMFSKQPYTEYISTRWYRAPECLLTDGYYGYHMDLWSVGCVFFEILSLHPLFPGSNEVDQISKIHDVMGTPDVGVLSKLRNKSRGMDFNFPPKKGAGLERLLPNTSQSAIDLIYLLCTYDPCDRISAKQALRHVYFRDMREMDKKTQALSKPKPVSPPKPVPHKAPKSDASSDKSCDTAPPPRINLNQVVSTEITPLTLTKAQSFPSQIQPFRERRKFFGQRRYKQYDSQHIGTGLALPRVSMHTGTLNPAYHQPAFSPTFQKHTGASISMLPSIASSYKNKKASSSSSKNVFSHYQLPSIDRRGAGY